jgi:HD-like signal output (HDOD) protein
MENKPKTYYRSVARAENMIGVSGVITLLADVARNRAEACAKAQDSHAQAMWSTAFERLRAFAAEVGRQLEEHQDDAMFTCPTCKVEMLAWQQGDHQC